MVEGLKCSVLPDPSLLIDVEKLAFLFVAKNRELLIKDMKHYLGNWGSYVKFVF
jgi:hypothetical protein